MRTPAPLFAAVVALALTPAVAGASDFCVGDAGAGCKYSYPATAIGLQDALDDADTTVDLGGSKDTVRIGPGTFAAVHQFTTTGGDLSIVGSGESTILKSRAPNPTDTMLSASAPATMVSHLQVELSEGETNGIDGFMRVSDVHVGGPGAIHQFGIDLPVGGHASRVLVDPAGYGATAAGIRARSGVVEDSLIRVRKSPTANYTFGLLGTTPVDVAGSYVLTARHLTILGDGASNEAGVDSHATRSMTNDVSETIHVRDSVLHGLGNATIQEGAPANAGPACSPYCHPASAMVDSRYSSLAAGSSITLGLGSYTGGPGDLPDPEPKLTADGSPIAGSPLIDAGDPAGAEAGDSPTDLVGHARVLGARRDIGAIELPPAVSVTKPVVIAPSLGGPDVTAPPLGGPDARGPARRLTVTGLSLTHRRFRVGAAPKRGTTVRFTLSDAATYTLRIDRVLPGRKVNRRGRPTICSVTSAPAKTPKGARCVAYRAAGSVTGVRPAGPVSVTFSGRLGRRPKALSPGSYRLTVTAHSATTGDAEHHSTAFTVQP